MTLPGLFVLQPVALVLAALLVLHAVGGTRTAGGAAPTTPPEGAGPPAGAGRPGTDPARRRRREARLFRLGAGLGVVLLCSPLEHYAVGNLFARALVDTGLAFVVAPLVVLGAPWERLAAALGRPLPLPSGAASGATGLSLPVVGPLAGVGVYLATLWIFHIPAVIDATVGSLPLRSFQLACLLTGGVLLWGQLVASHPFRPPWQPLGRVALIAATLAGIWVLAAPLVYSSASWYPAFTTGPTSILSVADRQAIAGAVLWALPTVPLGIAAFWCFAEWLGRDDEDEWRLDRLLERVTAGPGATRGVDGR